MEGLQLKHELELNSVASGVQRQLHLLASVSAPEARDEPEDDHRSPVDLVAVLDRSGSMAGAKLQSVKDTTKFLVEQLSPQDRLSIVTFETDVVVNFPLREMSAEGKAAAELAISRINPGGGTNLSGGLFKGIDQHQQAAAQGAPPSPNQQDSSGAETAAAADASPRPSARPDRIRTVFLFTDGQATTGVTNNDRLKSILNLMLENAICPTIHCFGFGHGYDAACLEAVAEAGQGQSAYIEDAESVPAALATALGGIMSIVAQNVEVSFMPKAGVAIRDIDTAFRVANNNGTFTVTLGDLFAEEKKDLLVKLQINALDEPQASQDLVHVQVRYLNLLVGAMKQSQLAVSISRPAEAASDAPVQPQVQEALLRLGSAKAMKDAVKLGDRGDLAGARDLLQQQLDKLPSESPSQVIIALRQDLQQLLNGYQNRNTYFSSRHHGLSMASSHLTQRHTTHSSTGPVTVNPYSSSTQQMYSRRATNSIRSAAPQLENPRAGFGIPTMPLPTSAPSGTNRAAGGNATPGLRERLISMQTQPYLPVAGENSQSGLERPTLLTSFHPRQLRNARAPADPTNDASSPHADPSFSQDWLHGAASQNSAVRAVSRRRTSDRASIQRAPSNVSAAGTEVYDPVAEGTGNAMLDDLEPSGSASGSDVTFPSARHPPAGTPSLEAQLRATSLARNDVQD